VLIVIGAVFQIVDGTQMVAMGALRGLNDTMVPFILGLLGYWAIGLTSGYVLGFSFGYGAIGLWWGLAIGLTASATLLTWRFHRRTRALQRMQAR
jgi:MATE family multidrug resistance protein